jgi:hypothetical protein
MRRNNVKRNFKDSRERLRRRDLRRNLIRSKKKRLKDYAWMKRESVRRSKIACNKRLKRKRREMLKNNKDSKN